MMGVNPVFGCTSPVMTTSSRLAASWCADTAGGIKNKMHAKKLIMRIKKVASVTADRGTIKKLSSAQMPI